MANEDKNNLKDIPLAPSGGFYTNVDAPWLQYGWSKSLPERTRNHLDDIAKNGPWSPLREHRETWQKYKFGLPDFYIGLVSALFWAPKFIVVFPSFLVLSTPGFLATRFFLWFITPKKDDLPLVRIDRTFGFYFVVWAVLFPLFLPTILLWFVNLMIDQMVFHVTGMLYAALARRWANAMAGFQVIGKYRYGWGPLAYLQGYPIRFTDAMIAIVGSQDRQTFFEIQWYATFMLSFVYWFKTAILCNCWVATVEERFITQQTLPLQKDALDAADAAFQAYAQDTLPVHSAFIDSMKFSAFYQLPPPNRNSFGEANGMQAGNRTTTTFTNTTHYSVKPYKALSSVCETPTVIVALYTNNPFHQMTGYVEVNSTSYNTMEHPMWLCLGDNGMAFKFLHVLDSFFHTLMSQYEDFSGGVVRGVKPVRGNTGKIIIDGNADVVDKHHEFGGKWRDKESDADVEKGSFPGTSSND